jgi:hypothetical protein
MAASPHHVPPNQTDKKTIDRCLACNKTNLMHYLSSVYWVTIPLHVSGLLVAHHQEVTMYICNNWYVLYVLVDCRRAWIQDAQHVSIVVKCYLLMMGY